MQNFADDSFSLPAWVETVSELIERLESQSNIAID